MLNVTQGTLKRHAGGYSGETAIGSTGGKIGSYGATSVVQPSATDQAAVTLGNTDGEIGALTWPGARVTLNGRPVESVRPGGYFFATHFLPDANPMIRVRAEAQGRQRTVERTFTLTD